MSTQDEYGRTPNDHFIMELQNMGLFVRDYDPSTISSLAHAADLLHRQLSKLDNANIKTWMDIPLIEVVNSYAKNHKLGLLGASHDS